MLFQYVIEAQLPPALFKISQSIQYCYTTRWLGEVEAHSCPPCDKPLKPLYYTVIYQGGTLGTWEDTARSFIPPAIQRRLEQGLTGLDGIGDRRPVTVLFADISGFTPLMESMDAEKVLGFLNAMFSGLLSVIREYGGTVDKFLGDAVMVVFGAPEVKVDDRERALLCALAIRREFDEFIQTGPAEFGNISISIGVNTGRAVAGIVGDSDYREYTVFGSSVNTAARLESAAKPGEILIGPATAAGLEPFFKFADSPPLNLKGIEHIFTAKILVDKRDVFKPARGKREFESIPVINSAVERTIALLLSGKNVQITVMPGGGRSIVTQALYSIWHVGSILHINEITGTVHKPDGQTLTVYNSMEAFKNSTIRRAPAVVFSLPKHQCMDGFEQIALLPLSRIQVRDLAARLHST